MRVKERSLSDMRSEAGRRGGKARRKFQSVFGRSFPIVRPTKEELERREAERLEFVEKVLRSSPEWRCDSIREAVAKDYSMLVSFLKVMSATVAERGGIAQRKEQQAFRSCRHVAKMLHKDLRLPGTVDAGPFAIPASLPIDEEKQAIVEAEALSRKIRRICATVGIRGSQPESRTKSSRERVSPRKSPSILARTRGQEGQR